MRHEVFEALEHHWALNPDAACLAAERMTQAEQDQIMQIVEQLPPDAVKARDVSRQVFADICMIPEGLPPPPKKMVGEGPCSVDGTTAQDALFDHIEQVQADNPGALMFTRLNGAKPRTNGKYLGSMYALSEEERNIFLDRVRTAFRRGIPILTEVTASWQLGLIAPYLTGYWLGARDATGSDLRATSSGTTFGVGIKNTLDGDAAKLQQAMMAIRQDNDPQGSGMRLPDIGEDENNKGISTGILPAHGNKRVSIIARGYEVPLTTSADVRKTLAIEHISQLCKLGVEERTAVILDGSHDAPKMFGIDRQNEERFPLVMREIFQAVEAGEITDASAIRGMLCEIGTATGRTDRNWIVSQKSTAVMSRLVAEFVAL